MWEKWKKHWVKKQKMLALEALANIETTGRHIKVEEFSYLTNQVMTFCIIPLIASESFYGNGDVQF